MANQNFGTGHDVFMGMGGWPARGSGVRRHSVSDLAPRTPCREAPFDGGGRHAEHDTQMLLKEIRNVVREEVDSRFRMNISGYPAGAASAFAREAKGRPHSASSERDSQHSQLYSTVVEPQDDPRTVLKQLEEAKRDAALLMFDSEKLYSAVGLLPDVLKGIEETKNSIKEAKVDIDLIKTATADIDLIKTAMAGLNLRPASEQIQAPQVDGTALTAEILQGVREAKNEIEKVITDINHKSAGNIIQACQVDVSPLTSEIKAVLQGLRETKNEIKQAISEIERKSVVEQTQAPQVDITFLTDEIQNLPRKIDFAAVLQGIQEAKGEIKQAITESDLKPVVEQTQAPQVDIMSLMDEIQNLPGKIDFAAVLEGLRDTKDEIKRAVTEIDLQSVVEQTQATQGNMTSLTDEIQRLPGKIDSAAVLQSIQEAKGEIKKAITEIDLSCLIEQMEAVLTANHKVKVDDTPLIDTAAILQEVQDVKNDIKTVITDIIRKSAGEMIQACQVDVSPLTSEIQAVLQGLRETKNETKTVITDIIRKSAGEIIQACQVDVSPLISEIQAVPQGLRETKNEIKQAITEIDLRPVVEQTQAPQVDITSLTDEILNLPGKSDFNAVLQGIQEAKDEVKKAITEIDLSFLIEQIEALLTASHMVKVPTAESEEIHQVDKSLSESQQPAVLALDKEFLNCCGRCDAECKLWVYRTPPLQAGDTEWVVYLTANKAQVPNYAQPVHGKVSCGDNAFLRFPGGAQEKRITLDGSSDGDCEASKPFDLIRLRGGENDGGTCALANLVFDLAPFGDFTFTPSQDVANSYNKKKKCVLPPLLRGPMSVGTYVG